MAERRILFFATITGDDYDYDRCNVEHISNCYIITIRTMYEYQIEKRYCVPASSSYYYTTRLQFYFARARVYYSREFVDKIYKLFVDIVVVSRVAPKSGKSRLCSAKLFFLFCCWHFSALLAVAAALLWLLLRCFSFWFIVFGHWLLQPLKIQLPLLMLFFFSSSSSSFAIVDIIL